MGEHDWEKGHPEQLMLTCLVGHSIHNLGLVGHIEDIAVAKDQQGKKLGLRIIEALDHLAKAVGCYKVRGILPLPFIAADILDSAVSLGRHRRQPGFLVMLIVELCRLYSTARLRTRDSMSSVGTKELDWRWPIIIRRRDGSSVSQLWVPAVGD